jgi:hypothetical protein
MGYQIEQLAPVARIDKEGSGTSLDVWRTSFVLRFAEGRVDSFDPQQAIINFLLQNKVVSGFRQVRWEM